MRNGTGTKAMEEKKPDTKLVEPARIVIEYDTLDGCLTLHANVMDEVLTTGMLAMAQKKLNENYKLHELREVQRKMQTEIIPASELKVQ